MSQRQHSTLSAILGAFLMAVFLGVINAYATATDAHAATQDTPATVTIAALPCEDTDGNVACYYTDNTGNGGTMVTAFYPLGADWQPVTAHRATLVCHTDTLCLVTYTP